MSGTKVPKILETNILVIQYVMTFTIFSKRGEQSPWKHDRSVTDNDNIKYL